MFYWGPTLVRVVNLDRKVTHYKEGSVKKKKL